MERLIPKPAFLDAGTKDKRFRFDSPTPQILQVLMCVRIASGLDACLDLLAVGHTTEIGVLLRTIDDFVGDVFFVDEVIDKGESNATTSQIKFLKDYFIDEKADPTVPPTRPDLKRRQKVQASEARTLGGDNPYRVVGLVKPIDDVLSGVVHGSYSSVMELYGGASLDEAYFHTQGMLERCVEYRFFLGQKIHEALNTFFKVAYNLGDHDLANTLREERREFEKSAYYSTK